MFTRFVRNNERLSIYYTRTVWQWRYSFIIREPEELSDKILSKKKKLRQRTASVPFFNILRTRVIIRFAFGGHFFFLVTGRLHVALLSTTKISPRKYTANRFQDDTCPFDIINTARGHVLVARVYWLILFFPFAWSLHAPDPNNCFIANNKTLRLRNSIIYDPRTS